MKPAQAILKDNDRLMPVITSVGYASIADINGVFYVGDVKHTVNAESVTIERTDAKTRAVEVEEIGYVRLYSMKPRPERDFAEVYGSAVVKQKVQSFLSHQRIASLCCTRGKWTEIL